GLRTPEALMRDFTTTFLNLDILREVWPLLAEGLWLTAALALVAVPLAVLGGLLVALAQEARNPVLRGIIVAYVDVMRAIPPLVLLILIFYGLPFLGLQLGEFSAAVLALTLNGS